MQVFHDVGGGEAMAEEVLRFGQRPKLILSLGLVANWLALAHDDEAFTMFVKFFSWAPWASQDSDFIKAPFFTPELVLTNAFFLVFNILRHFVFIIFLKLAI